MQEKIVVLKYLFSLNWLFLLQTDLWNSDNVIVCTSVCAYAFSHDLPYNSQTPTGECTTVLC